MATRLRLTLTTRSRHRRGFASRESPHAPRLVVGGAAAAAAPVAGPPLTTTEPPVAPAATHARPAPPPAPSCRPRCPRRRASSPRPGSDAGTCTAAAPCRSLDRAYHVAAPGEVVEVAGGAYAAQDDHAGPGQAGTGCATARAWRPASPSRPAAGATVTMPSLALGATYGVPGPAGVAVVATADRRLRTGS